MLGTVFLDSLISCRFFQSLITLTLDLDFDHEQKNVENLILNNFSEIRFLLNLSQLNENYDLSNMFISAKSKNLMMR